MERAFLLSRFGRIAPDLFHQMATMRDDDRVIVGIWLQGADAAPKLERPPAEEIAVRGREAFADRRRLWEQAHEAWMQSWAQPVVDEIRGGGGTVGYQSPLAPVVYATMPVSLVQTLSPQRAAPTTSPSPGPIATHSAACLAGTGSARSRRISAALITKYG